MRKQPIEEYARCIEEFENILSEWFNIYNEFMKLGRIGVENYIKKIDNKFVSASKIIDDIIEKDYPMYNGTTANDVYYKHSRTKAENENIIVDIEYYKEIAKKIKTFRMNFMDFSLDTPKFHGKTKVRTILDINKDIDNLMTTTERCMYNDFVNKCKPGELLYIF